jgi:23S rRNA pseudouridine955/2504/2580 synthase
VRYYKTYNSGKNDVGRRLDRVLKKMLPDVPAGLIYSALRKGKIRVDGNKSIQSYRIRAGNTIEVHESIFHNSESAGPDRSGNHAALTALEAITVLKTDNLLFVNKPRGMLTHGDNSLAGLIMDALPGDRESLSFIPAPLHRLDRNTSGLIAVGRTITGASEFSRLMRERLLKKYYLGLCLDGPDKPLKIEGRLTRRGKTSRAETFPEHSDSGPGRKAVTLIEPLLRSGRFVFCLFGIETGVTHQIRVQAASAGFPLAGDVKYGGRIKGRNYYILHSSSLVNKEHGSGADFSRVSADLPDETMKELADIFGPDSIKNALFAQNNKFFQDSTWLINSLYIL